MHCRRPLASVPCSDRIDGASRSSATGVASDLDGAGSRKKDSGCAIVRDTWSGPAPEFETEQTVNAGHLHC
jgi:hypothetical protein